MPIDATSVDSKEVEPQMQTHNIKANIAGLQEEAKTSKGSEIE